MDLLKSWLIIIILSFSVNASARELNEADLDSLEIENILHFFDTLSYQPDTGGLVIELDSIRLSDCSDESYEIDERLRLHPFKSCQARYFLRKNQAVVDSFLYYIDCYGGKQAVFYQKGDESWTKIIDISQKYVYVFKNNDSLGYVADNEFASLVDSVNVLGEFQKMGFFKKLKAAAGLLSNDLGISFAGVGRAGGKTCMKIYIEKIGKTVWYWKKLILKTETVYPTGDVEIYEAKELKIDIPLPDSIFTVPPRKWIKQRSY